MKIENGEKCLMEPLMELELQNIFIGKVFKSYRDLCRELNQPIYGGYQKTKQLEEFSRFFKFHKQEGSNKIVVTEIYETPLPPKYRTAPNEKYAGLIQDILLNYISKQENSTIYIKTKKLWLILGFVNENFDKMSHNKYELKTIDENMSIFEINEFYRRCYNKFYSILNTAISSMKRRNLIRHNTIYRIGESLKEPGEVNQVIGELSPEIKYRDATVEEEKYINDVKRNILDEFGYKNEYEIYLKNNVNDYYKRFNDTLEKEKGWNCIYRCNKIKLISSNNIDGSETKDDITEQKRQLNSLIIESIDKQAADRVLTKGKRSDYVYDYLIEHDELPFFYHDSYEDMQKILSKELLRI